MAKLSPPTFPEPRGIGQEVWVAACVAILVFTALVATLVPSFITNIKQALTQPSASRTTMTAPPITAVLYATDFLPSFQTVEFGPEDVGKLVEVRKKPYSVECVNTKVPGTEKWLGGSPRSPLITNVDRAGRQVPAMTARNPSYFRIEAPVVYQLYLSRSLDCSLPR